MQLESLGWTVKHGPEIASSELDAEMQICEQVSMNYGKTTGNLRQFHALSAIRDVLLPKLIPGELRVPGAEWMIEDVV